MLERDRISITETAALQAKLLGLEIERIQGLVRLSVPFSHPAGNRRYEGLLFKVEGAVVQSIARLQQDPLEEKRRKKKEEWENRQRSSEPVVEHRNRPNDGKRFIDLTRS